MKRRFFVLCIAGAMLLAIASCTRHKVEVETKPIEVKPIHITIDINVKVDRALDDFFGDMDAVEFGPEDEALTDQE